MPKTFKAQVALPTGSSSGTTHMQWVCQTADNAFEAKLAIEAKYGRILQGPTEERNQSKEGDFYDNF